jgi:metal-responsive CopG/Arc/MetJ family transcriptional regulator
MAKINVSIPDDLLVEIDAFAAELRQSRSGLVAEASARYVAELQSERVARRRRDDIRAAIREAREIARSVPAGEDTTEIIRRDRDTNHGKGSL